MWADLEPNLTHQVQDCSDPRAQAIDYECERPEAPAAPSSPEPTFSQYPRFGQYRVDSESNLTDDGFFHTLTQSPNSYTNDTNLTDNGLCHTLVGYSESNANNSNLTDADFLRTLLESSNSEANDSKKRKRTVAEPELIRIKTQRGNSRMLFTFQQLLQINTFPYLESKGKSEGCENETTAESDDENESENDEADGLSCQTGPKTFEHLEWMNSRPFLRLRTCFADDGEGEALEDVDGESVCE